MFEYIKGDIFDSTVQAPVNPVNCVGVMGKGLALQFKQRYPMNYTFYEQACRQGCVRLGHMFVFELARAMPHHGPQYILNFPTKRYRRDGILLERICQSLLGRIRPCLVMRPGEPGMGQCQRAYG